MKSLAYSLVLSLATVCAWSHAAMPDPSLAGCWRAARIVQYSQGRPTAEDSSGRCILKFSEDRLESSCATSSGTVTSTYRYRVDRPNFYSATMAGSTYRTSLIGSTREYEYHVDGDRLSTATSLQSAESAAAPVTVRVETQAARIPCQ
jgi:hypothetical protein